MLRYSFVVAHPLHPNDTFTYSDPIASKQRVICRGWVGLLKSSKAPHQSKHIAKKFIQDEVQVTASFVVAEPLDPIDTFTESPITLVETI